MATPKSFSISDPLPIPLDFLAATGDTNPFAYETLAQLRTQLAARLHDPSNVYWTAPELTIILKEALRTFSLLTAYWRAQRTFNSTPGTTIYDITQQFPDVLGRTVTDRDLINAIEFHFQEPPTAAWAGGWTGTDMFTMDDIAHALQKRRNEFLAETGVLVTRTVGSSGPVNGGRILLADNVMDIRRLAWTQSDGSLLNLWRVDEQEMTAYSSDWTIPTTSDPTDYSIMSPPPITVQLNPAVVNPATIDMLTISAGADFTPTTTATLVGVPDDMTWIVKWGAIADLLTQDGPALDPTRAQYAEQRYKHGVQLVQTAAVITAARINNVPLLVDSMGNLDAYAPGWQSLAQQLPDVLVTAGLNLIALSPPPDGAYPIKLDIVSNAVVPVADTDFIQIGREMIVPILDYAVHLAMFKVGGEEWEATNQGFEQLMIMAENYNSRMSAASRIWRSLYNVTNMEEPIRQRTAEAPAQTQGPPEGKRPQQ